MCSYIWQQVHSFVFPCLWYRHARCNPRFQCGCEGPAHFLHSAIIMSTAVFTASGFSHRSPSSRCTIRLAPLSLSCILCSMLLFVLIVPVAHLYSAIGHLGSNRCVFFHGAHAFLLHGYPMRAFPFVPRLESHRHWYVWLQCKLAFTSCYVLDGCVYVQC